MTIKTEMQQVVDKITELEERIESLECENHRMKTILHNVNEFISMISKEISSLIY